MNRLSTKSILLVLLLLLCIHVSLVSQEVVVSPTKGVWANYQSLVLNLPENYDAYYSLNGGNPLEAGFVYDDPVLLELAGDVTVEISIVNAENQVSSYTVSYSVNVQEQPSYIQTTQGQPTLIIDDDNFIEIPKNVQYSLSNSGTYTEGSTLSISGHMYFERNILLTINDGAIPYRYVLQIGDSSHFDDIIQKPLSPIEIDNWNYITFVEGGPVVYSVDDEPLRQTKSGRIYVDRTKDRILKWKKHDGDITQGFSTVMLPKKAEVLGLPTVPAINDSVTLTIPDYRYAFGKELSSTEILLSSDCFIDTIVGDAFGFADSIDIYFDGIKHGSIQGAFILDKIAPSKPTITTSNNSGYSRDAVTLTIQANDTVHYYIPKPKMSNTGFSSNEFLKNLQTDSVHKENFTVLSSENIYLTNNTGLAQSYEVYAFTSDFAGNTSDIVSLKTVVDPYNYYVTQKSTAVNPDAKGTIDDPYTNFLQVEAILNTTNSQNIFIDGVFSDLSTLNITKDTYLQASDDSRLMFASGETLNVHNALLSINGGTIEQSNSTGATSLQNNVLHAKNATLNFDNCEIILNGGVNSNALVLEGSSVQIFNSGITVQTLAYGLGINATDSTVLVENSRLVIVAENAIGMSFIGSSAIVKKSQITGIAPFSRSIEYINSDVALVENSFSFENTGAMQKIQNPAIWIDGNSPSITQYNNTFKGFTSLISE